MILKKLLLSTLVLMLYGCGEVYYSQSPYGSCVESLSKSSKNDWEGDSNCKATWYYAKDSVLVKNVDLSKVCNKDISKRVFSSEDIDAIRAALNDENVFIEIKKANFVNLGGENLVPDIDSCFRMNQQDNCHFFFIIVPYKKRKWFNFTHYADEYPVTYLNNHFVVVHNNGDMPETTYDTIKRILLKEVDSVDVERWIRRCRQGKKKNPYYINEGRPLLF